MFRYINVDILTLLTLTNYKLRLRIDTLIPHQAKMVDQEVEMKWDLCKKHMICLTTTPL